MLSHRGDSSRPSIEIAASKTYRIAIAVIFIMLNFNHVLAQVACQAEEPIFSHASGFYSDSIKLTLSLGSPGGEIRYTLDCSEPTISSPIYSHPITIRTTTVVRARVFRMGCQPGRIVSHSYFVNRSFTLPVLSVITAPSNLWGDQGIYTNYDERGAEWERPATIEFFEENGLLAFAADVGIRIHGGTSRAFDKKSLRYYLSSEYGQSKLRYRLFPSKSIEEFKCFVTAAMFQDAPGNSAYGNGTLLRDAVVQELGRRIEPAIALSNRPIILFLAGRPWGIYNLIERIDEHFLETNFEIKPCDIIENFSEAREGSIKRWDQLMALFQSNDFSQPEPYQKARELIDFRNFTRYHLVEIYSGNMDWPDYNNFAYCGYRSGDQWRWLLWDLDNTFAFISANTFELATDDTIRGTLILRKLLQNDQYRTYFLNECADLFNSALLPERVCAIIDSLAAIIRPDIDFEIQRWGGSRAEWESGVEYLKFFARERLARLWQYVLWELDVKETHRLTLGTPKSGMGWLKVNSVLVTSYPWEGRYFHDIPITLEAIPNRGFRFDRWSETGCGTDQRIILRLKADQSLYPIFIAEAELDELVINEINYNSGPGSNPEDWVELYNPTNRTLDLGGWHFKDDQKSHDFQLPMGTRIEAKGFLILCRDQAAFRRCFPKATNVIGDFPFGLGRDGDEVRIYHLDGSLIDSVRFESQSPWPTEANGTGATLELIDPALDNCQPDHWRASPGYGSPGRPNRYLPQVTSLVVKSKDDSTNVTNSREVRIEMTEHDPDGQVVKWLLTEDSMQPHADDFILTARPTQYYIQGDEGLVTIYAWVLDNDGQVSELTASSHATIKMELFDPQQLESQQEKPNPVAREDMLICFPNPFNQHATILIRSSRPGPIYLNIFNTAGKLIRSMSIEQINLPQHQIRWDGTDADGRTVPSGIYVIQSQSRMGPRTIKVAMIK
ncbi:MAG: CotH kinase family protein [candidate division KSB1 bacterium]|nr:CotH kinase family protein [candidate division KSB1 bacterium]